jgi:hypothetical protein
MATVPRLSELKELTVGCFLDGVPLPGAWVLVHVGMLRKNPFGSRSGPANEQGILLVTGAELVRAANADRNFALTDYGDPESECSGEVSVEPVGLASADRAMSAYQRFRGVIEYPDGTGMIWRRCSSHSDDSTGTASLACASWQ